MTLLSLGRMSAIKNNTPEHARLEQARTGEVPWKAWGPYLSERQWGWDGRCWPAPAGSRLCSRIPRLALERPPPPSEEIVSGGRPDHGLRRHRQLYGMQDEGAGLPAAQAAVERDRLLERAAPLETGVVQLGCRSPFGLRLAPRSHQVSSLIPTATSPATIRDRP